MAKKLRSPKKITVTTVGKPDIKLVAVAFQPLFRLHLEKEWKKAKEELGIPKPS